VVAERREARRELVEHAPVIEPPVDEQHHGP
jgi:hypothetical protein